MAHSEGFTENSMEAWRDQQQHEAFAVPRSERAQERNVVAGAVKGVILLKEQWSRRMQSLPELWPGRGW